MNSNNIVMQQKLRAYRKKARLTQQQVADAIGVNRSAYAYYETGKSTPKFPALRKLAVLYNVSLDELIYDRAELRANDPEYIFLEEKGIDESFNNLSEFEQNILLKIRLMNCAQKQELADFVDKF